MKRPIAVVHMKNGKTIKIEMYPEYAPNTVNNFIDLSERGYFDGKGFVRVVNNRLIQQGDPNLPGKDRTDLTPGYDIIGEFNKEDYTNPLSFKVGVVGMAMAAYEWTPNASAGSFFIMTKDEETLDAIVPAFGKVIEGMDEVERIDQLETHTDYGYDAPHEIELIETITIEKNDHEVKAVEKVNIISE